VGEVHRVYLVPGMFGFGRLAGYDYFEHVERALAARFEDAGVELRMEVVPTPPTASIRRRARVVTATVSDTGGDDDGPIHLIGHSTGGLDARLLASPTVQLKLPAELQTWRRGRLRTVTTMNTPHHGTPLAQFFTTVSGTRLLYALSLLTFTTLRYGGPPLTVFSSLVAAIGSLDEALGIDIHLLDRTTDLVLRFVGDQGRDEVRTWLDGISRDQGGILQITPETMDLFNATTENSTEIRYGSTVTAAPPPRAIRLATRIRSPYQALSATIYSTIYTVTAREHEHYKSPLPDGDARHVIDGGIGKEVSGASNDGIVPTLSQIWGELLWAGRGDHLDVVGHFHSDDDERHVDWLASGASYDKPRFESSMDAIASFLLRA
jgi:triacylglycerol esterase/lipase EstA (alpha/beta hydrolase family)